MLLALIAIEIYGFFDANLWKQQIWYPAGIERLRFFLGLFVGVATPVAIVAPWALAPLAAALFAAGTIHAVGWAAALTPVLFLVSAWSLGSLLLRNREQHVLAALTGAGVYVLAMTLTARLPIHYWWVWLIALAAPLPYGWRARPRLTRGRKGAAAFPVYLAGIPLLFVLLMHWLMVLKPEAGADGLAAHLAVAANIAAHHAYTVSPARLAVASVSASTFDVPMGTPVKISCTARIATR